MLAVNTHQIPRNVATAPKDRRRVAPDDGGPADLERVPRRLARNVGEVHDHSQTVHFLDDLAAECRQAVVNRAGEGRVGPGGVADVGLKRGGREREEAVTGSSGLPTKVM